MDRSIYLSDSLTDSLTEWLTDWRLTDWLPGGLADWLPDEWPTHWLTNEMTDWLTTLNLREARILDRSLKFELVRRKNFGLEVCFLGWQLKIFDSKKGCQPKFSASDIFNILQKLMLEAQKTGFHGSLFFWLLLEVKTCICWLKNDL